MATYEFICKKCGSVLVRQMTFAEWDEWNGTPGFFVHSDADCDGELRRLWAPPGIQIK